MIGRRNSGVFRSLSGSAGRFAEDTSGIAAIEFAILYPIMIMIMIMTITFSHMMLIDRKVDLTAQAVADFIATRQAVDLTDIQDAQRAAQLMMEPFADTFQISIAHVPFHDINGTPSMAAAEAWQAVINGGVPIPAAAAEQMADGSLIDKPASVPDGPLGLPGDAVIMLHMSYQYQTIWGTDFNFLDVLRLRGTLTINKITYARPRLTRQVASDAAMYAVF